MTVPDYITADFTRVNFQADANDIVAGWLVDDGDAFGLRGGGESYGWVLSGDPNDPNSNYQAVERDPNVPYSALKKTLNFMENETLGRVYDWEFAVDNGVYYVEITAGDPDGDSSDPNIYSSCRYILKAEGEEVLDGVPTASKRWISGSATVTVTDGRLTISGDSGALHNCISYVKFLKASTGEMPSSVDLEFSYDGRGNLLEDAHFEYAWDASDRIVEITDKSWETGDNGPEKVLYAYDAMGRRVLTQWHYESSTTQYAMVYDGVAPIEQGEISKGVAQRFYYEGKINKPALVEQFDATTGALTGALTGAYVPLTDDRGTVVGVYDVKVGNSTYGQLVEKLHYNATGLCKSFDPNGVENLTPGTDINIGRSFYDIPFGWCGMARDSFTGLYHTHFRDYDPVHGRWLSEDPAGYADGMNLYAAYMGVNGVDKYGLDGLFKTINKGINRRTERSWNAFRAHKKAMNSCGHPSNYYNTYLEQNGDYPDHYYKMKSGLVCYDGTWMTKDNYKMRQDNPLFIEKNPWFIEHPNLHIAEHFVLDVVGTADPTPVTDSAHAGIYLAHGELKDAKITAAAAVAGVGLYFMADALKFAKYSGEATDAVEFFTHTGDDYTKIPKYLLTEAGDGAKVSHETGALFKNVTREQRWMQLAEEGNLPKEVVDHINRHNGKRVSERFGLELAHPPKRANTHGFDYAETIPKNAADHRGIQHRYLKERRTNTTISLPKKKRSGGILDVPPPGALP